MPFEKNETPGPEDVNQQLERIRKKSKSFRRAPRSLPFLQFLVAGALEGKAFTEEEVATGVFGVDKDWAPVLDSRVRTGRNNLQEYLDKYYSGEGADDPVIIKVPLGTGYRAEYEWNPRAQANQHYRSGLADLAELFLTGGRRIRYSDAVGQKFDYPNGLVMEQLEPEAEFTAALRHEPNSALTLTARAEARLTRLLFWHPEPEANVDRAVDDANAALEVDPAFWRAHLMLGAGNSCRSWWDRATTAFESAQKAAPFGAHEGLWYLMYLMAIGRTAEALQIAKRQAEEHPDDPIAQTACGLVLYMTRRFAEADEQLFEADMICQKNGRRNWFAIFLRACVELAGPEPWQALDRLEECSKKWYVQGFLVACLAKQRTPWGKSELSAIANAMEYSSRMHYVPWLQRALAEMVTGEMDAAVVYLGFAFSQNDPWIMLIHLWPIFDPLRGRKDFEHLLERISKRRADEPPPPAPAAVA